MSKTPKDIRELSAQLESDFHKLRDLSHEELRYEALNEFGWILRDAISEWYRESDPETTDTLAAVVARSRANMSEDVKHLANLSLVMRNVGEAFPVPRCISTKLLMAGMPTREIDPKEFSVLELYQAVQRLNVKATELARDVRKQEA